MFQNNAEKLLESHLKFAHPIAGGSNNDNKPELKLDSSAEEWSEFLVPWNEYKVLIINRRISETVDFQRKLRKEKLFCLSS